MNAQFIKSVAVAAGIKLVKTKVKGKNTGRFGFSRLTFDDRGKSILAVEVSRKDYRSEDEAYAAAHKHYRLRTA